MKRTIILSILWFSGCTVNPVTLSNVCKTEAECTLERSNTNVDDEEAYKSYLIEECTADEKQQRERAKLVGCEKEYIDYVNCLLSNHVDRCSYDEEESDEYWEKVDNVQDNICWKLYARFYDCY